LGIKNEWQVIRKDVVMAINEIAGFLFLEVFDEQYLVIESDRLDEYIQYIISKNIKNVYLCNLYFKHTNLQFFEKCNFIEKLNISSDTIEDYRGMQYLINLKELTLNEAKGRVDLTYNPIIEDLSVVMSKNIIGLYTLKRLKKLRLWKYKPKSKDLSEISALKLIEELAITNSTIESLNGCGRLENLQKLELNYLNKLCYLNGLEGNLHSLTKLEFESCKKIKNHEFVKCLTNLQKLGFNSCGNIETIGFIDNMLNLRHFTFLNTNIVDGNLEPCIGIEYVAFTNKKHYTHKERDFIKKV